MDPIRVIERRRFMAVIAGGLLAAPRAAEAQQSGRVYRIGFLGGASQSGYVAQVEALRLGLRDHGYVEGRNITIEYRWAEGKYDRLPALAAELVRLTVDIIITHGTPAALAAKQATTTIPIVMAIVGDPVDAGIVNSLSRPGGNVTGSAFFYRELNAKRLEMIKAALPRLTRVAVLMNPDNPTTVSALRFMEERAQALNVKLRPIGVRRLDELETAVALAKEQAEALTIMDEGLFLSHTGRIAELAMRSRLPSIGFREYVVAGGLIAYGVDIPDIWRGSMVLVDKILKGTKPADLPIQQATRFELIINIKTAKALRLTIPQSFLLRADQVIE
jgi:putative tryptophan/tyrosine transport system substrate-binding protein